MVEIFASTIAFLIVGSVCLLFLALLFKHVMEGIEGLLRLLYTLILTIVSIPFFLFNPRKFMQGYRLGHKSTDTAPEATLF